MQMILLLLLICCGSAYAGVETGLLTEEVRPRWEMRDKDTFSFASELEKGLKVSNVIFVKRRLDNRWVLQLRKSAGLSLLVKSDKGDDVIKSMSSDEFTQLLKSLFSSLLEFEARPSHIQIDLALINEYRTEVSTFDVASTRCRQRELVGFTHCVTKLFESRLRRSEATERICKFARSFGLECTRHKLNLDPVVFLDRAELAMRFKKTPRSKLLLDVDAMWISIDLVP